MANLSDRATGLTNVNQISLNELTDTPSAPAQNSGQKKFYAKTDGKVYTLDDEGNEREVGSGSGASREVEQTDHGFAVGDVLYLDGTTYAKALANDEAKAEVVGVVSSIVDDNKFVVTSSGYIEEGLLGLTAGSVYYLSADPLTPGLLTLTEPGVIGHVSKPVLLADKATSGYVLQYRGVLVGAVFGEDTPLNADNLTEGTVSVARLPNSGNLSFRNILINGEVTRINQRGFDGNWAGLSNGDYGYDRWKKADASNITQVVEAGNFVPNASYVLSGTNVTTQTLTAPASGNWSITVPNTATYVQLEQGSVPTPFESRPYGHELSLCQRYYQVILSTSNNRYQNIGHCSSTTLCFIRVPFSVQMRTTPTIINNSVQFNVNSGGTGYTGLSYDVAYPDAKGTGIRIVSSGVFVAGRAAHVDVAAGSGSVVASAEL
jgi:hypothetical protein